ncbi:MAG: DNA-directed RNA polymerase subunit alpha C-terminal domain-containing protein [Lachnospiraceae bacterium]
MEKGIETYFQKIMVELDNENKPEISREEAHYLVDRIYDIGIINEVYYKKERKKQSSMLVENIEILPLSARAINALNREGILTCSQLRNILLGGTTKRTGKTFFEIRNIGTETEKNIIEEAIANQVILVEELGMESKGKVSKNRWEAIKKRQMK